MILSVPWPVMSVGDMMYNRHPLLSQNVCINVKGLCTPPKTVYNGWNPASNAFLFSPPGCRSQVFGQSFCHMLRIKLMTFLRNAGSHFFDYLGVCQYRPSLYILLCFSKLL
ncbi:hypothetical protein ATANTOWER_006033 [Ataeniobius toweri]|uniref:Uncharacterized protein n=1 Tax=Ataeniobius toweri TaxID=208326 RepID=A0ABU7C6K7_9TELE|nr:hypothetical protein [Ataeniobius toweri]